MNHAVFTGWLPDDVEVRVTPSGNNVLTFSLVIDSEGAGEDVTERIRVDDPRLIERFQPVLTKGRAVLVHCKRRSVPICRGGVVVSSMNVFVADEIECPNRSNPAKPRVVETLREAVETP